jgi:tetratricopeptide (TPR) repeat protein
VTVAFQSTSAQSAQTWVRVVRGRMAEDLRGALQAADAGVDQHPDWPDLLALRGQVLVRLGRDEQAEPDLRRAVGLRPSRLKWAFELAWLEARQGRPGKALRVIDAALHLSDKRLARLHYGRLLLAVGEYQRAARQFARAMGLSASADLLPLHETALAGLADDAAQGIGPEQKTAYRIALEHLIAGEAPAAEAMFAKLTRRCPAYAPAWIGWKGALEVQGKPEEAEALKRTWTVFSPRSKARMAPAMDRRLSRRGLAFDPAEPAPLRPMDRALTEVSDSAALQTLDDCVLHLDRGGELIEFNRMISLDGTGQDRMPIRRRTAGRFVAAIANAALVGRGVVLTGEGGVIQEFCAHHPLKADFEREEDHLRFDAGAFMNGACSLKVFDTPAFLLAGPTDASYGDWILNFPTRLALAEAADLDCPVVIRSDPLPQAVELLGALGIGPERILFHDVRGVSLFPRLYVPSWPLKGRRHPMKDLFEVYRRGRWDGPATDRRERLYLSREGVGGRRLVNEPQVRALFEQHGFRVVHPEQLKFEEVRRLFAEPSCVAGPYGSAFLNLVFNRRPPAALVLAAPEPQLFHEEVAFWLASLDVRLGLLKGEAGAGDAWSVDLEKVEQAIERVLAEEPR